MKKMIIFFVAIASMNAAEIPGEDPWDTMTPQQKIDFLTNEIDELNQDLEDTRKKLVDMKIWIIDRKDGSLEFHCSKISEPTYIIKNMYKFTGDELVHVMGLCFEKNGFDNKQKWAAHQLIVTYLRILGMIIMEKRTITILREKLYQSNKLNKKPTSRHT